jgi:hypothetical protein
VSRVEVYGGRTVMSVGTRPISMRCSAQWLRIPAERLGLRPMGVGLLPGSPHPTQASMRLDGAGAWHGGVRLRVPLLAASRLLPQREGKAERGPLLRLRQRPDLAAMRGDNGLTNGQAEPAALGLRGEEGGEHLLPCRLIHPSAGIGQRHAEGPGVLPCGADHHPTGPDGSLVHGLKGIDDEIHHQLVQLERVAGDGGEVCVQL